MSELDCIGIVGFGEAGRAVATGWHSEEPKLSLRSYDIKVDSAEGRTAMQQAWDEAGVQGSLHLAEAISASQAVFCLVTADHAVAASEAAAPHLEPGALWLDGNSCSPGSKRLAASNIEAAGGRYVDLAIMAPINPKKHRTPMLVAGPHAAEAEALMIRLGMAPSIAGANVGDASAIKMLRSVMIKGLEALTAECLLGARRAGVENAVLASLQRSDPGFDWVARSSYNLERMRNHGIRRAAEMREVAATLRELGIPDRLASATADWQSQIGELRAGGADLPTQLDSLLEALG